MRNVIVLGCLFLGFLAANTACSSLGDDAASNDSALTVENDRFVVSADPDRVVLKKSVDGRDMPWGASELKGKALLIFPIKGITEEGVYARATEVQDDGDTLTVTTSPLSLDDMEVVSEDQILIIKKPSDAPVPAAADDGTPALTTTTTDSDDAGAPPAADDTLPPTAPSGTGDDDDGVAPQMLFPLSSGGSSGAPTSLFKDFDISAGTSFFGVPVTGSGTVTHRVNSASLKPQVLAQWSDDGGLELGIKGSLAWDSTVTVKGSVSGTFFKSQPFETPPFVIPVVIGAAPAPVALIGRASISCSASASAPVDLSVQVKRASRPRSGSVPARGRSPPVAARAPPSKADRPAGPRSRVACRTSSSTRSSAASPALTSGSARPRCSTKAGHRWRLGSPPASRLACSGRRWGRRST
jgi:hypothetical protein